MVQLFHWSLPRWRIYRNSTGNIGIGLLRALTAVPGHADWGGIMGCLFAKAYFTGEGPGFLQGTFHPYPIAWIV